MHLLSNKQKAELCILAREAWDAHPEIREPLLEANVGRAVGRSDSRTARGLTAADVFNAWRRVEQGKACGKQSLCKSTSEDDYLKVRAHFEALCGREARAQRTIARHATEPKRVARYKLEQECKRRGLGLGYAASICRKQYRCGLDEASEKQLWRLVYTIKNRRPLQQTAGGGRGKGQVASEATSEDPF